MEWFNIKGFEDYQINKQGQIMGVSKKVLKGFLRNGNRYVELKRDGGIYHKSIKTLMVVNFIGDIKPSQKIIHIDGNIENNSLSNLSLEERAKEVKLVNDKGELKEFDSIKEAAIELNCCKASIRDLMKGRLNICKGYTIYKKG